MQGCNHPAVEVEVVQILRHPGDVFNLTMGWPSARLPFHTPPNCPTAWDTASNSCWLWLQLLSQHRIYIS